jgi:hypothetical protein
MGTVINFPQVRQTAGDGRQASPGAGAVIMILPVIRVERLEEQPPDEVSTGPTTAPGRRRRRRARRS